MKPAMRPMMRQITVIFTTGIVGCPVVHNSKSLSRPDLSKSDAVMVATSASLREPVLLLVLCLDDM